MKKIAVLPTLVTLGNTFCGFLAVMKTADASVAHALGNIDVFYDKLEMAVLLVFLAMIFDALDGHVARLTNQASDFGAQLDSLSDAITFGVAPAAMAKVLLQMEGVKLMPFLQDHPRILFFSASVYALFAVMRLARFNVETSSHEEEDHLRFKGLPTPAAGGFIVATILLWVHQDDKILSLLPQSLFDSVMVMFPWLLVLVGLAMVSPLPYPHLVNSLLKRRKSFVFLATLVLVMGVTTISYDGTLFVLTFAYICSGPVLGLIDLFRKKKDVKPLPAGSDDSQEW